MKIKDIKKELGKGTLVWAEAFRGDEENSVVVHNPLDIDYDQNCMYVFERFIRKEETNSSIIKFLCEKYSVNKVLAYQKCRVSTEWVNNEISTVLKETGKNKVYDCDSYYLLAIKKSVANAISEDGVEFIIQNN